MDPMQVVDVGRDALFITLLISAPMLIFGMVVGLAIGVMQAVTQIHEMTLTFIPKIVAVALAMLLFLPWMITKFLDYTYALFSIIPNVTG
ncbi:MAG: flagellar biosynthesis protein FliQ [Elusimicrobiota bacterium]